jgi:hypothetical protein
MEPICRPMASRWQMPFASSRGYGSLTLQHDLAELLLQRHARTGQMSIVYIISDHDPSGFDLQRAWEEALENFGAPVRKFVRIALTTEQVHNRDLDIAGKPTCCLPPSSSRRLMTEFTLGSTGRSGSAAKPKSSGRGRYFKARRGHANFGRCNCGILPRVATRRFSNLPPSMSRA